MDHGIKKRLGSRFFFSEDFILSDLENPRMRPLCLDFNSPDLQRRIADSLRHPTELMRAVEGRRSASEAPLKICDAMAGLGQDAYLLARRGHRVFSFERDPIVFSMLNQARAKVGESLHWEICAGDLLRMPREKIAAEKYDVLYLDPMFPPRRDGALQNRSMQILKNWIETEPHAAPFDLSEWLQIASEAKISKVIYKAPLSLELPNTLPMRPNSLVKGKSVAFHGFFQKRTS